MSSDVCGAKLDLLDLQRGLPGCGIATAHALARYGLGEALLAAVGGCEAAQSAALTEWRSTLRQLLEDDPKGYLGRRFKKLAASVPQSFPSSAVVNLYTHPITSGSADSPDVELGNTRSLPLPSVRLCELARLCEHRFTWGTRTGILKKFEKAVWPAATVRALLQDIARFESREEVEVEQQVCILSAERSSLGANIVFFAVALRIYHTRASE